MYPVADDMFLWWEINL